MKLTIRLSISRRVNKDTLLDSIETLFCRNNFSVTRKDKYLTFEKKSSHDFNPKIQLLVDLFRAFPKGQIGYDKDAAEMLVCKISHTKQFVLSAMLGLLVSFIFAFMQGDLWMSLLKIGLPLTALLLAVGIFVGNFRVKKLIGRAINS